MSHFKFYSAKTSNFKLDVFLNISLVIEVHQQVHSHVQVNTELTGIYFHLGRLLRLR